MTPIDIVRLGPAGPTVVRLPGDPPHYVKICESDDHADAMRAVIAEAHRLGNGLVVTAQRRYRIGGAARPCYVTREMPGRVVHPVRITNEMAMQAVDLRAALTGMTRTASLYSHVPAVAALIGAAPDGAWTHGDFDVLHMYWRDGVLAGAIDFDTAMAGDGRYDLGMLIYSIARYRPPDEAVRQADRLAGSIAARSPYARRDLLAWSAGIARHRFETVPGTQHIGPGEKALAAALWKAAGLPA